MCHWNRTIIRCPALLLLAGVTAAAAQAPSVDVRAQARVPPDSFGKARHAFQSPAAPPGASDASFDAVLAAVEAAQVQLVNGQPGPFKALWSHDEGVTLSGGLGGAVAKGWTRVSERLDWVATQYVAGVRTHQEVARYVGQDLAYVVLRETIRFKNPANGRAAVQELRVSQVLRREGGRWRIVHRHADSQVVRNPAG